MRPTTLLAAAAAALTAGLTALPAAAHTQVYQAALLGSSETPANGSPGTGLATVTIDFDLLTMRVQTSFSGLSGTVTAAHIHCCTSTPFTGNTGVATVTPTFTGFPSGVTSGSYDHLFDMSLAASYNSAFITASDSTPGDPSDNVALAFNALVGGLDAGRAYLNLHTSVFGGGELRALLAPVPEADSAALMLAGLAGIGLWLRRRPVRAA